MGKRILGLWIFIVFTTWSCSNSGTKTDLSLADSAKTTQNNANNFTIDLKKISFSGTEPFWSLKFEPDFAIYTSPEQLDGVKIFYKKNIGDKDNCKLEGAVSKVSDKEFRLLGLMGNSSIEITIKNEKCSNGMSEEDFSYSIVLLKDKKDRYEGCGKIE